MRMTGGLAFPAAAAGEGNALRRFGSVYKPAKGVWLITTHTGESQQVERAPPARRRRSVSLENRLLGARGSTAYVSVSASSTPICEESTKSTHHSSFSSVRCHGNMLSASGAAFGRERKQTCVSVALLETM